GVQVGEGVHAVVAGGRRTDDVAGRVHEGDQRVAERPGGRADGAADLGAGAQLDVHTREFGGADLHGHGQRPVLGGVGGEGRRTRHQVGDGELAQDVGLSGGEDVAAYVGEDHHGGGDGRPAVRGAHHTDEPAGAGEQQVVRERGVADDDGGGLRLAAFG